MDSVSRLIVAVWLLLVSAAAFATGTITPTTPGTGPTATWCGYQFGVVDSGGRPSNGCAGGVTGSSYLDTINAGLVRQVAKANADSPGHDYRADGTCSFYTSSGLVGCSMTGHYTNLNTSAPDGVGYVISWGIGQEVVPFCANNTSATGTGYSYTCTPVAPTCPSGSTASGLTCVCNGTTVPNSAGTSCVAPPPTCKVQDLGDTNVGPFSTKAAASVDIQGCVAECVRTYSILLTAEGAAGWYGTYRERQTGANCTGNDGFQPIGGGPPVTGAPPPSPAASGSDSGNPKPSPPQNPCNLGNGAPMCPATVSGAQVCVVCNSTSDSGSKDSYTPGPAASGASPGATGNTGGAGGGGAGGIGNDGGSVERSTTCSNGTCVTTSTTRNSSGAVTGSSSSSSSQGVFCASNPGNANCSGGSKGSGSGGGSGGTGDDNGNTFGGSCGGGFTCKADAVQCAMARDQLARNCQTLEAAPGTDPAVMAAGAGDQPSWHPAKNGTSVSMSGGFDQTNIVAGSCPSDQSFAMSNYAPVVIPFSKLCTPATWLGNILVGLTALTCIGIVFVRGS